MVTRKVCESIWERKSASSMWWKAHVDGIRKSAKTGISVKASSKMLTAMMELGSKRTVHGLTFIAKFVVSRCAFWKLRGDFGFFCSVNHFSEGGVNANHNVTCLPSLAENDSRLLKNSEGNRYGEWILCRRKEADVALFLQVTRMRNIIKICEANLTSRLLPETGRSQSNEPWNTKPTKRIEIHQSRITNHDLLNSCK